MNEVSGMPIGLWSALTMPSSLHLKLPSVTSSLIAKMERDASGTNRASGG